MQGKGDMYKKKTHNEIGLLVHGKGDGIKKTSYENSTFSERQRIPSFIRSLV